MTKPIPMPEGLTWATAIQELKAAGISQTEVAVMAGCPKSTISELSTGVRTGDPTYPIGYAILWLHRKHVKGGRA